MVMPERNHEYAAVDYRYAYNGMEQDNEAKGSGNSYTTEFRQYDPRLGRWLSLDPVTQPDQSPFCGMDNNPILYNDPLGDKVKAKGYRKNKQAFQRLANELGVITGLSLSWKGGVLRYKMQRNSPYIRSDRPTYSSRARAHLIRIIDDNHLKVKVKMNNKRIFTGEYDKLSEVEKHMTHANLDRSLVVINLDQIEYMQNHIMGGIPRDTDIGEVYARLEKMTIGIGFVFLHEQLHLEGYRDPGEMSPNDLGGVALQPSTTDVRNSQFAGEVESILNTYRTQLGNEWGQRVSYSMITTNFIVIPFTLGKKSDIESGGTMYSKDPCVTIPRPKWYEPGDQTIYTDPQSNK